MAIPPSKFDESMVPSCLKIKGPGGTVHSIMCVQCDFSRSDIKPVDGQFFFCSAVAVPRVFSKVAKLSRVSSGKLDS
jgi:hypothetical protein